MFVTSCSHCGAQAQVPDGQTVHTCRYCGTAFNVPGASPPPERPSNNEIPQIVVIHEPAYPSGFSWTLRIAIFAIIGLSGAGGLLYKSLTGHPIADDLGGTDWNGATPLACGGSDVVNAHGVKASFVSGYAISAGGDCKVTCTDCQLKAPEGLMAAGSAQVTLVGGTLEGTETAIAALGNATVELKGTGVIGPVSRLGNAMVHGLGSAPAHAAAGASGAKVPAPPKPQPSARKK